MPMTFRTITAKYPGICRRCNGPIAIGDRMRYGGPRQTWHLREQCPATAGLTATHDLPELQPAGDLGDLGDVPQAQPAAWEPFPGLPGIQRAARSSRSQDAAGDPVTAQATVYSQSRGAAGWQPLEDETPELQPAGDDFGF